jgi:phage terminase large subunit-like protein
MLQPSTDKLEAFEQRLIAEQERRRVENRLAYYRPYPKQSAFHAAGAKHRERLLMAGNQLGKTLAGAMETAIHATGRYPAWWQGKRFDKPTVSWVAGTTGETVRDTVQRMLIGRPGQEGTAAIPKDAVGELVPARGIPDLLDSIRVRHESGAISTIGLKSYLRGRESFQGETLDFLWFDEEPPPDVYFEALTRTNVSQGPIWLTFTPLTGVSTVVKRYLMEPSPDRHVTTMTIDDVGHFSEKERTQIIDSYPEHEREARTRGVPTMGSGRIFPTSEENLLVDPFDIPTHWLRWGGCDFGWTHYAAFTELAWDRDLDIIYLVRTLRLKEQTPIEHAQAIRPWRLLWAWPRDGKRATLEGAGVPLMRQYADAGLDMMHEHAQFEDGGVSVEAGLMEMADRMRGGRWKVFKGQNDAWLEEYRLYHRDADGRVVAENDDAISASRYGLMMRRHARVAGWKSRFYRPLEYQQLGIV